MMNYDDPSSARIQPSRARAPAQHVIIINLFFFLFLSFFPHVCVCVLMFRFETSLLNFFCCSLPQATISYHARWMLSPPLHRPLWGLTVSYTH